MLLSSWLSLLAVCLLGAISPGPSLAVVLRSTLAGGRVAGLAAGLAHGVAVACYALLTVAGLSVVIARTPQLFIALQLAGAGWLIYLGTAALRSHSAKVTTIGKETPSPAVVPSRAAANGFMVAFLNPKLALFMLALFSQFVPAEPTWSVYVLLVLTISVTDALWYCLVALVFSRPAWLAQLQSHGRRVDLVLGDVLVLLGTAVIIRLVW